MIAPPHRTKAGSRTIFLLAAISALGSLATQLVVPALPLLAHDLRVDAGEAQLVIGVFLFGLAAGQLLCGPLTDRIGRKPVLLAGMAVYCLASAVGALATSFPVMLAARSLQALGGSAGVVTSRVLVSDLYPPEEAAGRQAMLMAVILISPMLGPVLGGFITEVASWRMVFGTLCAAAVIVALLAAFRLPGETRTATDGPKPGIAAAWQALLTDPAFLAPTLTVAGGSAALYMFLGMAPFLLARDHGLGPREVGIALMVVAVTSIIGTFLVTRLERLGDALLFGTGLLTASCLMLVLLNAAGFEGVVAFMLPMGMVGLGAGISGPAAITRVIASNLPLAGTASSLCGAIQMASAAAAGAALGQLVPPGTMPLGMAMIVAAAIGLAAATWNLRMRKPLM